MPKQKNLLNPLEDDFSKLDTGRPNGGSAASPMPLAAPAGSQGIVPGWTWETDDQGRYLFCAPEVRTLLGLDPASLVGQPLAKICLPSDTRGRQELTAALQSQRPLFDLRLQARSAAGALRIVVLNALPLFDPNDQFLGYRGVAHILLQTGELSSVTHPPAEPPASEPSAQVPPPAVKVTPAPTSHRQPGTAELPPLPPTPKAKPGPAAETPPAVSSKKLRAPMVSSWSRMGTAMVRRTGSGSSPAAWPSAGLMTRIPLASAVSNSGAVQPLWGVTPLTSARYDQTD